MLEFTLEFKTNTEPPSYSTVNEKVEGAVRNVLLDSLRNKYEVEGMILHSWSVSEVLPYDEGRTAAIAGDGDETNPYASSNWKHEEWNKGWNSIQL